MSQINREISSSLIGLKQGQIINWDRRTGLDLKKKSIISHSQILLQIQTELLE